MQRFFSFAMALCLGLSLTAVSFDADARRMGNKKSFGAAPSHQARQTPAQTPAAAPNAAAAAAKPASGASKWLGPLAGLAAGGLLASMLMGDGFEGFQIMDFLLMAALAFAAFKIFQIMRRRNAPAQQPMPAGGAPFQREAAPVAPAAPVFGGAAAAAAAAPVINAPAWFNETSFVEAGRSHFLSLQQHWDSNEMDKIAEFVTPQMLEFLTRERAELGDGFQSTYIENLNVALDGVDDNADKTVATLTFTGLSKNSRFDQGEVFSESWRLERAQGENQPWLVAGIRQN